MCPLQTCKVTAHEDIMCPMPEIQIPKEFEEALDMPSDQVYHNGTAVRTGKDSPRESKRNPSDGGNVIFENQCKAVPKQVGNTTLEFYYGILFDGYQKYRNLTQTVAKQPSFYSPPALDTFTEVLRFKAEHKHINLKVN